ncbi:MAG: NADH-quinone oxidoreductase subunit N [Acidobacteria bacterium]|nr:NADH-quinone oxidoreductase subunit N [Acidobacteriota bacterium]
MSLFIPNILNILPEVTLAVFGLLVLGLDLLLKNKTKVPVAVLSIIGFFTTAGMVIHQFYEPAEELVMQETVRSFSYIGMFYMLFLGAAILTVFFSIWYLKREKFNYGEFYGMMMFVVLGMFVMASANDLLTFFIGLELMSIALYIIVGLFRTRKYSNEAAIKYFIMGSFASAFLLFGIALIYGITGSTKLNIIAEFLGNNADVLSSPLLMVSVILLISGFAFKLGLVPFHMWTPDVYQGAPTTLTAFMSVAVKGAALCVLITVLLSLKLVSGSWVLILTVLAVITMTVGNVAALRQKDIKRMLAYSSIAHAGYILVAIVALSNPKASMLAGTSVLFYLMGYLFMNFGAFTIAYLVAGEGDEGYDIENYKGLSKKRPLLAGLMAIFMFSLIGIPPLVGFMAKFQVFYAAVKASFITLTVIAVLNSVVAVYYYLRVVVTMYMDEPEKRGERIISPWPVIVMLIILALAVILFGIFPDRAMDAIIYSTTSGLYFDMF